MALLYVVPKIRHRRGRNFGLSLSSPLVRQQSTRRLSSLRGTPVTAWDGKWDAFKIKIANVYAVWDDGTAILPQWWVTLSHFAFHVAGEPPSDPVLTRERRRRRLGL